MAYQLVIVESAAKSKTIQKYLNQNAALKDIGPFKVVASLGHVVNTPPKELGIDTATWDVTYQPIDTKKKVLKDLKEYVKDAKGVYLAADPDREGEAIAWHLEKVLKLKQPKRIVFHEITPKAVEEAIKNPRKIDTDLVASQETRVVLDKLVGFKVSPLLWHRFANSKVGLSAGRVQSVVLRNIVEKFQQYESHAPETFWTMEGTFEVEKTVLEADLYDLVSKKKQTYPDPAESLELLEAFQTKTASWSMSIELKSSLRNPSSPYTTSALQQEVYETYSIPAKQTMQLAQKLYEGGFITYMRTDSVQLSDDIKTKVKEYILEKFDAEHYQERTFKSKVANAQEAHECIRPTNIYTTSKELPAEFTEGHRKVYDIIWRKTVASQMSPAMYSDVIYHIQSKLPEMKQKEFQGKKSYLIDPGFLKVWQPSAKVETEEVEHWKKFSELKNKNILLRKAISKGNITKPEGLYNEASIIKWMEKEGIGRPSTYASIIDKIFDKGYVMKGSNPLKSETVEHYILDTSENTISTETETIQFGGKEKDRLIPSATGVSIVEYLQSTIPKLMDYHFTANVEDLLDHISRKKATKNKVLDTFYQQDLVPVLEKAEHDREEYRKNHPKEKTSKKELAPKTENILKEFPAEKTNLIHTRYGPALFHQETKKFISVTPFLQWKKKEQTDLTSEDVNFLQKFPISINKDTQIEYGRYGLYMIYKKKNVRIPKPLWDKIYNNTYSMTDIQLLYPST